MALFESNGLSNTRVVAGGDADAIAIRTFNDDHTSYVVLPYDDAERLRDYLNEYLIRFWPQEEDTE